jgi:hypothetical protein
MRKLLAAVAVLAALAVVYRRFLRRPILDWGSTAEEAARRLPGDELLPDADLVATRSITIGAPPSAVWPWLVQMGPGRGGMYTYDWIENLFGLDIHSTDRILPEHQHLEVGDVLRFRKGDLALRVEILEPERALSLRWEDGSGIWTFVLDEHPAGTRLLSRNRVTIRSTLGDRLAMLASEPGSLVMERKMLLGIKERAERLAAAEAG